MTQPLPWLNSPIIKEDDPTTPFAKGYHLYLGLFNIEETADRARHVFANQPSQWRSVNWKNCAHAGSTTAFAKMTVTTHGIPLIDTLALSTLPWAHGHLLNGNKETLTIEYYWKSVNRLLLTLREKFAPHLPKKLMKEPKIEAKYLNFDSLCKLTDLLFAWANYTPLDYPLVLIEPVLGDKTQIAKEPNIQNERNIPILNSFYIQDLESAAIVLSNQKGKPLDLYLSGIQDMRISFESEKGQQAILNTIRPENLPAGRWPDSIYQHQSLMQQFAINAIFQQLKDKGIFSVNGPPGTGKTSLLREIIAENIVARATQLSRFEQAQNAFIGRHAISFENCDQIFVSELDPSLLGYEMLIASSNNSAVQNLSKELPLRSQLAPSFHAASYLEAVATKILGAEEKNVWGLIAATLGNKENCRHFIESAFISASETKESSRIWEWIDTYKGPSFVEARESFIKIKKHQEQLFEELEILAFLHEEISCHTIESYCADELKMLNEVEDESEIVSQKLSQLILKENEEKELLQLLQEQDTLLQQERPNLLARIVKHKAWNSWNERFNSLRQERMKRMEHLITCKTNRQELLEKHALLFDKIRNLEEELLNRAIFFYTYQETYDVLKKAHLTVRLPRSIEELNEKESQIQSYYQTHETNKVRSDLFIAALTLHEAWLAETLQVKGGFRGNLKAIANVIQGKIPTTAEDMRRAWQNVFLLVPVISSTFASIGRIFRYLEPGSLGWLLIDEAGQAPPQAAVGAIWRAKRVLAIGDPFQIEPICTIPGEIIDGMAKSKIQDYTLSWAPSQVSVQNIMDRACLFGSKRVIQEESFWLGSPLRVHRRCVEPMFTISNLIAYDNSMLLATHLNVELPLLPSCWWDVSGHTSERQYIPISRECFGAFIERDISTDESTRSVYHFSF